MKLKNTEPYKSLFTVKACKNLNGTISLYNQKKMAWKGWIFRGQSDSEQPLMTTIERLATEKWEIPYDKLPKIEYELIRKFMRHFHNYSQYMPQYISNGKNKIDKIEWLSIMRHYGTATRLLDCTYSFYVALFFALKSNIQNLNSKKITRSAVLAFDAEWLYDGCWEKLTSKEIKKYNFKKSKDVLTDPKKDYFFLFERAIPSVYPVNAFKLNERLIIQQGCFLAPGNLKQSFIENLKAVAEKRDPKDHLYIIQLPDNLEFLKSAIYELNRMNMNSATLFPGLPGFAEYLNTDVILRELIKS
jgi:hypothetical protein